MESSPDFQPSTAPATSAALSRPTLARNLGFWLLALLLGSVLMLLYLVLTSHHANGGAIIMLAGPAVVLSLAALPLLLPLLPWALVAPAVGMRWLRVFTLQSLSLGGLTALGYVLAGGGGQEGFGGIAPVVGTLYFGTGLLAAPIVYWPWLRRPQ